MSSQTVGVATRNVPMLEQLKDKVQSVATWSSSIEGRLLTIVDAMFSDKDQREAMKSLIRNAVRDHYQDVYLDISRAINEFSYVFEGEKIEYQKFDDPFTGYEQDIKKVFEDAKNGTNPVPNLIFTK